MLFHADLHLHSKYSRATGRDADLEHLAYWAGRKGLAVIATGDFTHPVWMAELKQKLVPAEPGLFRLRADIEQELWRTLPAACRQPTRFMLSVEISTIYKKGERTRKVHHLLYAPDFDAADWIVARLGRIGNLAADGRPILGLDSRHLLEITLESHPASYLVPAHIWTPWFAALGSKSGFDSIDECYGDLAGHIFALETGLSSDPPMNWRLSQLDRYRLVSNSDAHSPPKLGREATRFDCTLDYFAIRHALEIGDGYVGTVEFFPEEGKYHHDGHRQCGARLTPRQTLESEGRCPQCGQPVTVGVLHRIEMLADRTAEEARPPATAGAVCNLVPLPEMIAEIAQSGPSSKTVARRYEQLIATLGSELEILTTVPIEDIARADSSLIAEAVSRLRAGQVIRQAGYDGEYGVIRLFTPDELQRRTVGGLLFDVPSPPSRPAAPPAPPLSSTLATRPTATPSAWHRAPPTASLPARTGVAPAPTADSAAPASALSSDPGAPDILATLDEEQRKAALTTEGSLLIIAGPGSGKTRTLTHRLAHLIATRGVPASSCLALTFTRRAAAEMRERLARLLPDVASDLAIHTFHSLSLAILREHAPAAGLQRDFRVAGEAEQAALLAETLHLSERKSSSLLRAISKAKRTLQPASTEIAEALLRYHQALADRNWIDLDDLVGRTVELLVSDAPVAARYRDRFRYIAADEFQDVDEQQYRLVRALAPAGANLCVIGDPNQAIYGFRGADAACFTRFTQDYPNTTVVRLVRNYRSSGTIVTASSQVIAPDGSAEPIAEAARNMLERVTIHAAPTEPAEAEFVVHTIERMIGGHTFFSIDSGRTAPGHSAELSFADFAVLYRTEAQAAALCEAFGRSGMPFQKHDHEPLAARPGVQALLRELDHRNEHERTNATAPSSLVAKLQVAAELVLGRADSGLDRVMVEEARQQLAHIAAASAGDWMRFAEAVSLAADSDAWDPRADRASLLTIHAAKGLEFPVVFLVGLEDGLLPLHWGDGAPDPAALAEERRLFYVGMTRAKDRLILSHAAKRQWRGRSRELASSPFLKDIADALIRWEQTQVKERRPEDHQLALL